jgi:hypothetical protein
MLCQACTSDDQCSSDGTWGCWLFDDAGKPAFCAQDCSAKQQCLAGAVCTKDTGDAMSTCLPANPCGAGAATGATGATGTTGTTGATGGMHAADCTDTWTSYAEAFFSDTCSDCHTFATTYSGVTAKAAKIREKIASGEMPQDAILSAAERARILAWIDCGAQD